MSKYTPEQVERYAGYAAKSSQVVAAMLRDFATLLRERKSAKAGVTDEMVERAITAWFDVQVDVSELDDAGTNTRMRAALEAVAPMLASARVPDGWQLVPVEPTDDMVRVVYPLHWYEGPGRRLKIAYKQMLAVAPKPEKE